MQDHYKTLNVDPTADQETIQAAYEELRARHDPAMLEGAAEELVELAQRKRDEIDRAYAVLGDTTRRATYDEERQAVQPSGTAPAEPDAVAEQAQEQADELLDYSPLPPAGGQERPRTFNTQPHISPSSAHQHTEKTQQGPRSVFLSTPVVTVAIITFVIMLSSLILTGGGRPRYAADTSTMQSAAQGAAAQAQPTPIQEHDDLIAEYEQRVVAARQVAQQVPDNAAAWVQLGNALYDRVQVVRELQPNSVAYREQLPLWLEASEAYNTALSLGETSAVVRSDMGVSQCYYGAGTNEQQYVEQGILQTQQALQAAPQDARVLLNHGVCLVSMQPPRTPQAVALWRQVLELSVPETGIAQQAQHLIEQHSQSSQ